MNLFAPTARLSTGWAHNVTLSISDQGLLTAIKSNTEPSGNPILAGPVIPGMPNAHSHAFQYLMAGLAEQRISNADSFWSWRELMYRYAATLTPAHLEHVATALFIQMLKAGYTSVCEFHYLHHQPDGRPHTPETAMCEALIRAAHSTGIELVLLPTLYMQGGFDGRALVSEQKRFMNTLDQFCNLLTDLKVHSGSGVRVGAACHSLRAVPEKALDDLLVFLKLWPESTPFHLHIAEQHLEVQEAIKSLGQRPVEWLLDHVSPGSNWCLVHATHMTDAECRLLANSNAVAGLCPTTEANLGDGLFPLVEYIDAKGSFAIGSDSQISISAIEELRWLEYGQRLDHQKRHIAASDTTANCGDFLWNSAVNGGALASGCESGGLSTGNPANFIVLEPDQISPNINDPAQILDTLIFAGSNQWIRDVYVRGKAVISDHHHAQETAARSNYRQTARQLHEH